MKFKTFALLISAVTVTAGLCAAIALIFFTNRLEKSAALIQSAVQSVYAGQELRTLLLSHNRDSIMSRLGQQAPPIVPHAEREHWFSEIDKHVTTTAELEIVREVKKDTVEYFKKISAHNEVEPITLYLSAASHVNQAAGSLDKLIELNRSQAEDLRFFVAMENSWANMLGVVLISVIFVFLSGTLLVGHRLIFLPVQELKKAIESFRHGQSLHPCQSSKVLEFREIGEVFNDMSLRLARQRQTQLRFIAGIVHDIRNPLNALQSALHLLKSSRVDAEKRDEIFGLASKQVSHLASLTKDLADTASIESGQLSLHKVNCNVASIMKEVVNLFTTSSEIHSFSFEGPDDAVARCDPERLTQVINNLISNAIKYSPRGGAVKVRVEELHNFIAFSISDQGIGISKEDQAKIFEPFRRTAATENAFLGMGLGLSVVKKIVEAHGGTIYVESVLGEGSSFRVRIPRQESYSHQDEAQLIH